MSYICSEASFAGILKYDVESFIRVIEKLKKFPTKIIYNVFIGRKLSKSGTIYELETNFCEDFVYDDSSNPEFYYFRQTFLSANSEEMLFEIRIPKMKD
uniref:Uncharacterized protein n=1 Tax=Panagrolaimus davidi TaxID=227884 RepID=A0A914Q6G3_9BILA